MKNPHIEKIKSRGYWRVVVGPLQFNKQRVANILDLRPILDRTRVGLRGWDFPAIHPRNDVTIGEDWICQSSDWNEYIEYWRFFQSGQFIHLDGFNEDWVEQSEFYGPDKTWPPGQRLGVYGTLYRFTEIFEFASRLSLTPAGDAGMALSIKLSGLEGRQLWWDKKGRKNFNGQHTASISDFEFKDVFPSPTLIADGWNLAADQALELFRRFGWNPPREVILDMQSTLRRWAVSIR